jgi:hypothetical protein
MTTGDYGVIIYLFIGIVLTIYWWNSLYKKDYKELIAKGECEEPMVILFWLFTTYIWPVVLCVRIIKYYHDKKRQNQFREFQERNRNTQTT